MIYPRCGIDIRQRPIRMIQGPPTYERRMYGTTQHAYGYGDHAPCREGRFDTMVLTLIDGKKHKTPI